MSDFETKHIQAVEALRKAHEEGNEALKSQVASVIAEQEQKNQDLVKKTAEAEKKAADLEQKFNAMEADLRRSNISGDEKSHLKAEMKSFDQFIRGNSFEAKTLRTDIDSAGGYLVPEEVDNMIIKKITEISNIRAVASVRQMGYKTLSMPVRTSIVSAFMVGEAQDGNKSQSSYGDKKLVAKSGKVISEVTNQLLQDSGVNILTQIAEDAGEAFGELEGSQFVNGSGTAQTCQGFMTKSGITEVKSGSATTLSTFDPIIEMIGKIKSGYKPIFGFNKKTLAHLMVLKDGTGQYIWQAGNIAAGVPNRILGHDYIELPDMPDIGAGTYPIVLADFRKGYVIGDRSGLSVIRDAYTKSDSSITKFVFEKRFDGQVAIEEAFCKLKISA